MDKPFSIDPAAQCPLCGQNNRCAMEIERATGVAQAPCWCVAERFPPDLIARLPLNAQDRACICSDCLRTHAQDAGSSLSRNAA